MSAKLFLERIGSSKQVFQEILNGHILPSLQLIEKIEKELKINILDSFFNSTEYMRGKTNSNLVKIPKEITTELVYLLGALRDGSLVHYSSVYEIEYGQKNKDWLEKAVIPKIEKVFGLTSKAIQRKNKNFVVRKRSVAMFNILNNFSGFAKVNYKSTPKMILNLPFELQKYYIAGFYDAEGCKNPKDVTFYQQWFDDNGCPPLIDIQKMLDKINVKSHFRLKPQNNVYLYDLHIGAESKRKFLENIPVEHPVLLKNL